ncbi:MAG TPA: hypothetical protein EYQ01_10100 [Nitrospira sp.]|jgi:hypothetical protein|nr:hypothetical protein [Candidatus Manganitrophaceae bacterium]
MLGSARFLKLAALRPVLENYMRMLHAKVPVQRPGLQGIVGTLCLLPIKAADFSLGDFRKLGTEQYTKNTTVEVWVILSGNYAVFLKNSA